MAPQGVVSAVYPGKYIRGGACLRYEALCEINRGATCAIWLGRTEHGRLVALKVLSKQAGDSAQGVRATALLARNEIRVASTVHHENVAELLDVCAAGNQLVLVWELIRGPDLIDFINASGGAVREDVAAFYFEQLLRAVAAMHQAGVCHRDLKPENCMIEQTTNSLKVVDFGVSKELTLATTMRVGTPDYMAPEMLSGSAPGRPARYEPSKVDVWGVGVILYLMVCGAMPFEDPGQPDSLARTLRNIQGGRMRTIPQFVSPGCRNLVHALLAHDADSRLTLAQASRHPWLLANLTGKVPPHSYRYKSSIPTDEELVQLDEMIVELREKRRQDELEAQALKAAQRAELLRRQNRAARAAEAAAAAAAAAAAPGSDPASGAASGAAPAAPAAATAAAARSSEAAPTSRGVSQDKPVSAPSMEPAMNQPPTTGDGAAPEEPTAAKKIAGAAALVSTSSPFDEASATTAKQAAAAASNAALPPLPPGKVPAGAALATASSNGSGTSTRAAAPPKANGSGTSTRAAAPPKAEPTHISPTAFPGKAAIAEARAAAAAAGGARAGIRPPPAGGGSRPSRTVPLSALSQRAEPVWQRPVVQQAEAEPRLTGASVSPAAPAQVASSTKAGTCTCKQAAEEPVQYYANPDPPGMPTTARGFRKLRANDAAARAAAAPASAGGSGSTTTSSTPTTPEQQGPTIPLTAAALAQHNARVRAADKATRSSHSSPRVDDPHHRSPHVSNNSNNRQTPLSARELVQRAANRKAPTRNASDLSRATVPEEEPASGKNIHRPAQASKGASKKLLDNIVDGSEKQSAAPSKHHNRPYKKFGIFSCFGF